MSEAGMSITDRSDSAGFVVDGEENSDMARIAAKKKPSVTDLPVAEALARELTAAAFDAIITRLEQRAYDKERVVAVAALYLGRSAKLFKTKPAALRAMWDAFRQRSYAKARNEMNGKVTPF
jgi:hypothetical protein